MGYLSIAMAALLVAGAAAGGALAVLGQGGLVGAGLIAILGSAAALLLVYLAIERLGGRARGLLEGRRRGAAMACAVAYGVVPMVAVVALQLIADGRVPAAGGDTLALPWRYAVAAAPTTLLGLFAGRARRTLWSIRAYAAHLSAAMLLLAPGADRVALGLLMLLPAVLPMVVGFFLALADQRAVRAVRL